MTALCGGGTSAPDTGVTIGVAYGAAKIAQMLETYGAAWALEVVPLLVIPPIVTAAFCATDPPAIPTFTADEANALLQVQLGTDFVNGLGKMVELVQHLAWYDICRCTSGTLTSLPAAAPAPSGTAIVQQPEPQNSTPCSQPVLFTSEGGGSFDFLTGGGGGVPSNATSVQMDVTISPTAGTGSVVHTLQFDLTSGQTAVSPQQSFTWTGGAFHQIFTYVMPPNVANFRLHTVGTGTLTGTITAQYNIYCGGLGPGLQNPCCPPDTVTQAQLNAILNLVTLIQRQIVPFGSVQGAAHSGLTGQGSFSVPRLLGVQVVLTTIPASYGVEVGSPDVHFDLGWLSASTPDGFIDETRITRSTQAWYPRIMSDVNLIGYSLSPGVVATITEVEAEV